MTKTKQKAEMTPERLASEYATIFYNHDEFIEYTDAKKKVMSDLRSVIRGELIRFAEWYHEQEFGFPILNSEIDEFLNNNQ